MWAMGDRKRRSAADMKILLVEDDDLVSDAISLALSDAGHVVTVASDGLRGLEEAAHVMPELVITDLGLRGVDGVTVISTLRRNYPALGLIAISGGAGGEAPFRRALAAGADHCLQKPFTADALLSAIGQAAAAHG